MVKSVFEAIAGFVHCDFPKKSCYRTANCHRVFESESCTCLASGWLDVEQKVYDVAVLHGVLLAFGAEFSSFFNRLFAFHGK